MLLNSWRCEELILPVKTLGMCSTDSICWCIMLCKCFFSLTY